MTLLLGTFTSFLAQYFLVALVWLVGVILSLRTWRQHPKLSGLTLLAIAIFLVTALVSTYTSLYLPILLRDQGWTNSQLATLYYPLHGIVVSLLHAIAWGLVLAAIFTRPDKP